MSNRGFDLDSLLELAQAVSAKAAALALSRPTAFTVNQKSSARDFATQMDHAVEELIVTELLAARPEDGIVGEESGARPGSSGITWIIDPIDGTVNYFYGLPGWNISIAAKNSDGVILGVVNAPTLGMIWHATRGGGAYLNGQAIAVNQDVPLSQALLATGFSYLDTNREIQRHFIAELLPDIRDIRRNGAAAVDLCFVASGFVDGYFEIGLYEWDLAAGGLIAREAGALVTGRNGGPAGVEMTVAAAPALHAALIARIG